MFRRRDVAELFDDDASAAAEDIVGEVMEDEADQVAAHPRPAPARGKMTLADHFAQQAKPFDQARPRKDRPAQPTAAAEAPRPVAEEKPPVHRASIAVPPEAVAAPAPSREPVPAPALTTPAVTSAPASVIQTPRAPQPARQPALAPSPTSASGDKRVLTVGPETCLKGEISRCDRVVIEGQVDAQMNDVNVLEIVEGGRFNGAAKLGSAVISGMFEGTLHVSGLLVVDSAGAVNGTVTYGELEIRRGGRITGEINRTGTN